ncbi:MAG: hypothetical protein AVDCRST_MAG19-1134 [uncultured Thermomicrobiales bacterium]|uniref:Uncharacterized protein n=1 Tax=uncultured Thermomicrobiales bacterium TaxID=1645740 RepID=A0A6J4UQG1_9BACT|nr:MAG: hypothetical protein AVDCRST_MAG19-1134 [uncultured Thermomicrobiales bacterium]
MASPGRRPRSDRSGEAWARTGPKGSRLALRAPPTAIVAIGRTLPP